MSESALPAAALPLLAEALPAPAPDVVLPGVDRAAFAVSLERRLRAGGLAVSLTATADLVTALRHRFPRDRSELYWLTRLTMVSTHAEIALFDEVFAAVFDDAVIRLDPAARRQRRPTPPPSNDRPPESEVPSGRGESGIPLPWFSPREISLDEEASAEDSRTLPELRPSALAVASTLPFGELSEADMQRLAHWVEHTSGWPTRLSRRTRRDEHGHRVALRHTLAAARRTGHEPVNLVRQSRRRRPRRIVMVCDVSQSMQSVAAAHLHLMRALANERHAEVFAFSTALTRLTHTLRESTPAQALAAAAEHVDDRLGGTRIASSLRTLVESHHGGLLRGAVVVIASDGWDSEPPEEIAAVMARVRRRAHTVVWLNPRAAAPDFVPGTGAMAAALPHCDLMLPAGTFADLRDALARITATATRSTARAGRF